MKFHGSNSGFLQMEHNNTAQAKAAFYQGIHHCPWSKVDVKGLHVVAYISKPDVLDYVWCGVV